MELSWAWTLTSLGTQVLLLSGLLTRECFLFPICIVPATSPLGILEPNIRSDDNVHMISMISSSPRPMVYPSNLRLFGLLASRDDGTHKHGSPMIQVVT